MSLIQYATTAGNIFAIQVHKNVSAIYIQGGGCALQALEILSKSDFKFVSPLLELSRVVGPRAGLWKVGAPVSSRAEPSGSGAASSAYMVPVKDLPRRAGRSKGGWLWSCFLRISRLRSRRHLESGLCSPGVEQ